MKGWLGRMRERGKKGGSTWVGVGHALYLLFAGSQFKGEEAEEKESGFTHAAIPWGLSSYF